jgi:tetratricopeptide (TPR) repeat protein
VQSVRSHLGLAERMLIEYRAAIAAHAAAPAAVADAGRSVVDAALAVLDAREATRGFGLACRASAAMEQGERGQASDLIVQALGIGGHPDYYGMAIEVALRDGDTARAEECARRGFEATSDDSEACLVFAAILGQTGGARRRDPESWPAWKRTHAHDLAPQMLRAALNAIRTGRDYSAIVLLERCLASTRDPSLRAQAQYHRGSALKRHQRLAEARACFESVLQDAKGVGLLADSTRAALLFHLGELDLHDGATVAAIAHFDACLALNPAHRRARALRDEAVAALAAA